MYLIPTAGCSPPSLNSFITNGRINHHINGSVGSVLTFECDTGYLPYKQTISRCFTNGSWIPTPHCVVAGIAKMTWTFPFPLFIIVLLNFIDCGTPNSSSGLDIEPYNSTQFNSTITFRCQDGLKPETVSTAVCDRRGVWSPNPSHYLCVNQSGSQLLIYYRDSNVMIVI